VLPAAFGEFKDAPNLNNYICAPCNNGPLGLLDQQIARCGPEALLRKFYAVEGRAEHVKVNPFARGSAGGRRIEFSTFDREFGVEVNLEIEDGNVTQLCELIFVEKESGKTHHLPIRKNMTPAQLREGRNCLQIVAPYETRLSCYPHEQEWLEKLVTGVWPAASFSEGKLLSNIIEKPVAKFEMGERYFRAIAKIGFHYFLTQFPKYTGREEMFTKIREFIYKDNDNPIGRINEFMGVRRESLLQGMIDPKMRPAGWRAHILAAEVQAGVCAAHVQMFLTEEHAAPIYTVVLAGDSAIQGDTAFAHAYLYYREGKREKFSGEAMTLPIIRMEQKIAF
jgi:hypothetical protein